MMRMPTIIVQICWPDVRINHFLGRKCSNRIHALADYKSSPKEYDEDIAEWSAQESAVFGFIGQTLGMSGGQIIQHCKV